MQLVEVNSVTTRKLFHETARRIYKEDKVWVCPPDNLIDGIFDPAVNVYFQHGSAVRWVLEDDQGGLIGRVGAFLNENKAYSYQQPTGGIGFFECINDQAAANLLFDTCRKWLMDRGMQAMDGPINFGENDNFWGLLVEGFTHPNFGMNYNPPYYKALFENYGFNTYYEQISNHLDLYKPFPERFWRVAEWILKRPGFRFEHLKMKEAHRFVNDIKKIYDEAWAFHESFTPLDPEVILKSLGSVKSFLDEELIWFVYHEDEPIAFLVMLPDINLILKNFNGKMNFWNKLRFYYIQKTKGFSRARITIMGVVPQFQRLGVESGIFWQLRKVFDRKPGYREVELSWVGDFNPKMRALHDSVGGSFAKKHITYRKLFTDEDIQQRSYVIPADTKEKLIKK